ncbi:hypothetical protein HK405_004107, partial [Cladochytrium tenue]
MLLQVDAGLRTILQHISDVAAASASQSSAPAQQQRLADVVPWLVDNYAVLFGVVLEGQGVAAARTVAAQCLADLGRVGRGVVGVGGALDPIAIVLEDALARVATWGFVCDVAGLICHQSKPSEYPQQGGGGPSSPASGKCEGDDIAADGSAAVGFREAVVGLRRLLRDAGVPGLGRDPARSAASSRHNTGNLTDILSVVPRSAEGARLISPSLQSAAYDPNFAQRLWAIGEDAEDDASGDLCDGLYALQSQEGKRASTLFVDETSNVISASSSSLARKGTVQRLGFVTTKQKALKSRTRDAPLVMSKKILGNVGDVKDNVRFDVEADRKTGKHPNLAKEPKATSRKGKMAASFSETQDQSIARSTTVTVFGLLRVHEKRENMFHAAVAALYHNFSEHSRKSPVRLTFSEKASDRLGKTKMPKFKALVHAAFALLHSIESDVFSRGCAVLCASAELKGRAPGTPDEIIEQHAFISYLESLHLRHLSEESASKIRASFAVHDLIVFARSLFEHKMWDEYKSVARILNAGTGANAAASVGFETQWASYESEIRLRSAAVEFWTVLHTERRVLFGQTVLDAKGTTKSVVNLAGTPGDSEDGCLELLESGVALSEAARTVLGRFSVSRSVRAATLRLIDAMVDCLRTLPPGSRPSYYPSMVVDAAQLLWRLVEPSLRNTHGAAEFRALLDGVPEADTAPVVSALAASTFMAAMWAAHSVAAAEFPAERSEFAVGVSGRLAGLLQSLRLYGDAAVVAGEALAGLEQCRAGWIARLEPRDAISCNLGLFAKLLPEEDVNASDDDLHDLHAYRCICSFHVDMFMVYVENRLRAMYQEHAEAEMEAVRQSQKLRHQKPKPLPFDDARIAELCRELCGRDPALRSLFYTVYSVVAPGLIHDARIRALDEARDELRKAYRKEHQVLTELFGPKPHAGAKTMVCPPPTILKRTATSLTLRANPIATPGGAPLAPMYYQVFCKKADLIPVTLFDAKYEQCGVNVVAHQTTELVVSGLMPNQNYKVAVAAFDNDGALMGDGVGEQSIGVTASLPMPLFSCWIHLVLSSFRVGAFDLACSSMKTLWSFFITWLAPLETLCDLPTVEDAGIVYPTVYQMNEGMLSAVPAQALKLFLECIHSEITYEFSKETFPIFCNQEGSWNPLRNQQKRLLSARQLLMALQIAEAIKDIPSICTTTARIYTCLKPFIDEGIPTAFSVRALELVHGSLCTHLPHAPELEQVTILHKVFAPLSVRLSNQLAHWGQYARALKFAEESIKLIALLRGQTDLRIMNSQYLEQQWVGAASSNRKIRYGGDSLKNRFISAFNENSYHGVLATGKNPALGYEAEQRKELSDILEALEALAAQCHFILKPAVVFDKRNLDSHTSVKDLFTSLYIMGPDSVANDLMRFRKNPRYLELVCITAEWTLSQGHFPSAVKICQDVLEWLHIRNSFLKGPGVGWADLIGKHEVPKKKFFHGLGSVATKKAQDRGRPTRRASKTHSEKHSLADSGMRHLHHKVHEMKMDQAELQKRERSSRSSSPGEMLSRSRSRGSSPDKRASSQHSRGHSAASSRESLDDRLSNSTAIRIGRKRKKLAQKNMMLATLSAHEKDKYGRAVAVLEHCLGGIWQKRRFKMRLKSILAHEAVFHARIANALAMGLFATLERDPGFHKAGTPPPFLAPPLSITMLYNDYGYAKACYNLPQSITALLSDPILPASSSTEAPRPFVYNTLGDAIHYFVQGVVLAARVQSWEDVVSICKNLWRALESAVKNGCIQTAPWQPFLFWPLYLVSSALVDMLGSCRITNEHSAVVDIFDGKTSCLELGTGLHALSWTGRDGFDRTCRIDLVFVGRVFLTTVQYLKSSKRDHKLHKLLDSLPPVFQRVCSADADGAFEGGQSGTERKIVLCRSNFSAVVRHAKGQADGTLAKHAIVQTLDSYCSLVTETDLPLSEESFQECGDILAMKSEINSAIVFWSKSVNSAMGEVDFLDLWTRDQEHARAALERATTRKMLVASLAILKLAFHFKPLKTPQFRS